MFANVANIPLVLIASLAIDGKHLFGADAAARGIAYVAVNFVSCAFEVLEASRFRL